MVEKQNRPSLTSWQRSALRLCKLRAFNGIEGIPRQNPVLSCAFAVYAQAWLGKSEGRVAAMRTILWTSFRSNFGEEEPRGTQSIQKSKSKPPSRCPHLPRSATSAWVQRTAAAPRCNISEMAVLSWRITDHLRIYILQKNLANIEYVWVPNQYVAELLGKSWE